MRMPSPPASGMRRLSRHPPHRIHSGRQPAALSMRRLQTRPGKESTQVAREGSENDRQESHCRSLTERNLSGDKVDEGWCHDFRRQPEQ